jgi:hypothetical protein
MPSINASKMLATQSKNPSDPLATTGTEIPPNADNKIRERLRLMPAMKR